MPADFGAARVAQTFPNSGGYRLVGEGAGSKTESGVALAELQRLTTSEIVALGAEARLLQSKPKR